MSVVCVTLIALDHTRMGKIEYLRDIFVGRRLEKRHPDHVEPDDDARDEGHQRDDHHQPLHVALAHLVYERLFLVFQETHHGVGRQGDEYRVDEKEVERPEEKPDLPVARPKPAVQRGGISAVAIATPGITVEVRSCRVCATIPARPPNNAISTS